MISNTQFQLCDLAW